MATKTINWDKGGGSFTVTYGGSGNGTIVVTSDANTLHESRSQSLTVKTTKGGTVTKTITVTQAMKPYIDLTNAVVTAANQTYSGSALTPTPTVKLNGVTVPSTGYDVIYSNNTNAGTATITITGKGDYTGTATGTFTIAKASRTLTFSNPTTVVAPSGNVTNTATPSAGSSDGTITYSISPTTYATVNSSTGKVTAKTSEGSATVTATISEGTNYLSASASYVIRVFSTVHAFAYTGNVQSLNLPAGTYKLQVWGAQGGSNAAASSYGITAQAGGKGGYSEGILTIGEDKTVYVFVGGQGGSSGNGGWNGGGGGSGSSSYNSGNTHGVSRMGCGGGGTDIALVTSTMSYSSYRTNRSSESLLSRIIVAGGGSGGAMCYKAVTTSTTTWPVIKSGNTSGNSHWKSGAIYHTSLATQLTAHESYIINFNGQTPNKIVFDAADGTDWRVLDWTSGTESNPWIPDGNWWVYLAWNDASYDGTFSIQKKTTTSSTSTDSDSKAGYVGGGTSGGGYSSTYQGKQTAAGTNGGFGYGANQTVTNYRYGAGCGGGGWYGGGNTYSDDGISTIRCSGGGSGFVNTAANAQHRPSGYTGLQLDSGTTYAGNQSFPAVNGGNETGHSGNGYARITRIQ